VACDAKCDKAWGINNRPRVQLSDDEDDYEFLADDELGAAPVDPGTYEGGHAKPDEVPEKHNKWCARECERSVLLDGLGHGRFQPELEDFTKRVTNKR
jgi:hypothetical protein